jgi:hypothetical protein
VKIFYKCVTNLYDLLSTILMCYRYNYIISGKESILVTHTKSEIICSYISLHIYFVERCDAFNNRAYIVGTEFVLLIFSPVCLFFNDLVITIIYVHGLGNVKP